MSIIEGLRKSIKMYPNCRIANCECNSSKVREEGCRCLCHVETWKEMGLEPPAEFV